MDNNVISVLLSLCLHKRLFIGALWSPAGKGLTSLLSFVMSNCELCHFAIGLLGQVWFLILLIPDLCHFLILDKKKCQCNQENLQLHTTDQPIAPRGRT